MKHSKAIEWWREHLSGPKDRLEHGWIGKYELESYWAAYWTAAVAIGSLCLMVGILVYFVAGLF